MPAKILSGESSGISRIVVSFLLRRAQYFSNDFMRLAKWHAVIHQVIRDFSRH